MEAEVSELTGLPRGERNPDARLTHRNRERRWYTRVGTIELGVPRVRDGSYLPSLLEPRRRTERVLLAVVQEAYVSGVSTRRVDDLIRAFGIEGMSRSEVSRICGALDAEVEAFRHRPLGETACPYLFLDATYLKVREGGRVVSMADLVPRSARSMVASAMRSVFEQPDGASAREQLDRVIDGMAAHYPRVAELLADAETDLLAHFGFPEIHRRQIRSTNPLERLNEELKRRTGVVGIFSTRPSVLRQVEMVLAEQDDECQDGRRHFGPETMAAIDAVKLERRASRSCSQAERIRAQGSRCHPRPGT